MSVNLSGQFFCPSAFTNSPNRAVINSSVASTSQLSGGQLLPGRSLGTGATRWGFCSLTLAADALAVQRVCS